MSREYKLRTNNQGASSLGVPTELAEALPSDQRYTIELTEDGILYRPVKKEVLDLPTWARRYPDARA